MYYLHHRSCTTNGVKSNIGPRLEFEATSVAFWTSVLTITPPTIPNLKY